MNNLGRNQRLIKPAVMPTTGRQNVTLRRGNVKKPKQTVDVGMLQNFKNKATAFNQKFEKLKTMRSQVANYPALNREFNTLVNRGASIKTTISTITGGVDSVVQWFNNLFGKSDQVNGLGLLPLIPIAIVAGSLVAMGKFATDIFLFQRRFEETKRLEQRGIKPARAAEIVAGKAPIGVIAGMTREVMIPVTIAGTLLIAGWYFLNAKK